MTLPVRPPVAPMLAKLARELPRGPGLFYEPKWDGFRCIVFRDGDDVELGSRNEKPLTRYFPELVDALRRELPERCVLDGEIVIAGPHGLEFDALSQRIHPAEKRIRLLAESTPASFVAFDLLAEGSRSLLEAPYAERRRALETALKKVRPPIHVTPVTADPDVAGDWFSRFEGAGLDGVVVKDGSLTYQPDKRAMVKVKHQRTADCVVAGSARTRTAPAWAHCSWGCSIAPGRCTTSAWRQASAWRAGASWSPSSSRSRRTHWRATPGRAGPKRRRRDGRPEAGIAGTPGRT